MKKMIEALKTFGLSEYEAKVLLALIAKGELTAKEVAEYSGVPRTSVYDVIKSLMAKGLVEAYGKPMKFKALNSDELMKIFSKKVEENLKYLREELPSIEKAKTEEIKIYRGDLAIDKLSELIKNAKSVTVVASYVPDEISTMLKESDAEVRVCTSNVEDLRGVSKVFRINVRTKSKHGIIIVDGRTVAIFFKNGQMFTIVGSGEGFVEFYKMFVESLLNSEIVEEMRGEGFEPSNPFGTGP